MLHWPTNLPQSSTNKTGFLLFSNFIFQGLFRTISAPFKDFATWSGISNFNLKVWRGTFSRQKFNTKVMIESKISLLFSKSLTLRKLTTAFHHFFTTYCQKLWYWHNLRTFKHLGKKFKDCKSSFPIFQI